MAKEVKSIRIDEELTDLFKDYSNLLNEMFGYSLAFSNVVSESLSEFLMDSSEKWLSAMRSQSVVDRLPNGKLKRYRFTDKQIERMADIWKRAAVIWHENSGEDNSDAIPTESTIAERPTPLKVRLIQSHTTIAEEAKQAMTDTIVTGFRISKKAEDDLYYLMLKFKLDNYDEVVESLIRYAVSCDHSGDNAEMIYQYINE